MSITYTWKVTGIKIKTEGQFQDAVVQTYWQKIGTDEDGNTGTFSGATPFSTANVPEDYQFIPFNELSEEVVLEWIKACVVEGYEEHVNGQILKQIENKKNPEVEITPPWLQNQAPTANTL